MFSFALVYMITDLSFLFSAFLVSLLLVIMKAMLLPGMLGARKDYLR